MPIENKISKISDEEFINLYKESVSVLHLTRKIGLKNTVSTRKRLIKLIGLDEFNKFRNYTQKSKYRLIPLDKISKIVKSSITWTEVYQKMGYVRGSGTLQRYFREYLKKNNIDFKHLTIPKGVYWSSTEIGRKTISEKNKDRENKIFKKIPTEEYFVENSKRSNTTTKLRIFKENLIEYKCAICNMPPIWCGKPITLILDHINGNRYDNRLENLRFHCPNCGSQLETHAGRNKAYLSKEEFDNRKLRKESFKSDCVKCKKTNYQKGLYCFDCLTNNKNDSNIKEVIKKIKIIKPKINKDNEIDNKLEDEIDNKLKDEVDNKLENEIDIKLEDDEEIKSNNFCIDCNTLISTVSKRCVSCYKINKQKHIPPLEILLYEVENMTYKEVAKNIMLAKLLLEDG